MSGAEVLRVVHVLPSIPYGGMQKVAAMLGGAQISAGIQASFICVYDGPDLLKTLGESGATIHAVHGEGPSLLAFFRFARLLSGTNADIVHLHSGLLWTNAVGLIRKRNIWVYHAHNYPGNGGKSKQRALWSVNRRLADAYIAVSRSVAGEIRSRLCRERPIKVIYNGVPSSSACSPGRRLRPGCLFGMASRLAADKGILEFVEVATAIKRLLPNARFRLAGDGPLRGSLPALLQSRGLDQCFQILGHVGDVEAFWRGLDVAVFTAPKEPFGLRLLEPMAAGTPVVGYQTGAGSDEVLRNGVNSLVAKYNDREALAAAAVSLASDMTLSERIASTALEDVRSRFSVESFCREVAVYYDELRAARA